MSSHGISLKNIRRSSTYFLMGGDLHILVEGVMFRVHKFFFDRESNTFRREFVVPVSPGAQPKGATESTALVLEDVTLDEFEKFLWVFYNPRYSIYDAAPEDWVDILKLAHMWKFREVYELAVRELERLEMPVVERLIAYQAYDVNREFVVPLYAELFRRDAPLSKNESQRLGIETVYTIWMGRERLRAKPTNDVHSHGRSPLPAGLQEAEVEAMARDLLADRAANSSPGQSSVTSARATSLYEY
ncbi:hypothetical protein BD626DRAFT_392982 [Schizophyllum amplum]|uniref:BTB domain-containing protein n=1 Tax=Schizophyllum amplum TaxID=97359 RepID=A0A550CW19_9AGAR|nr:hypothetical protein BD626DRAFT_392982 [Auriculariopsis ampla]